MRHSLEEFEDGAVHDVCAVSIDGTVFAEERTGQHVEGDLVLFDEFLHIRPEGRPYCRIFYASSQDEDTPALCESV